MVRGVIAKFSQNPGLKEALKRTHKLHLAEFNPNDRYWSTGLSMSHPNADNPSCWTGQSALGKILMQVRDLVSFSARDFVVAPINVHDNSEESNEGQPVQLDEETLVYELAGKIPLSEWQKMLLECKEFNGIYRFLLENALPDDATEAKRIMIAADNFVIHDSLLYKVKHIRYKHMKNFQKVVMLLAVPSGKIREELIWQAHYETAHSRVLRLYLTLKSSVYWRSLFSDIEKEIKKCENCLLGHRSAPGLTPLSHFSNEEVGHTLFVDTLYLSESLDDLSGQKAKYLLVMIDGATSYCVVSPLFDLSAKSSVAALSRAYIAYFGIPKMLVADSGSNFTAKMFTEFMQQYSIQHRTTCVSNHKSLSLVERKNRVINGAIRTLLLKKSHLWLEYLPEIMLAINATVSTITNISASELFLARKVKIPCLNQLPETQIDPVKDTLFSRSEDTQLGLDEAVSRQIESREKSDKYYKAEPLCKYNTDDTVLLYYESAPKTQVDKLYPNYRLCKITEVLEFNSYRLRDFYTETPLVGRFHASRLRRAPREIRTGNGAIIKTTNEPEQPIDDSSVNGENGNTVDQEVEKKPSSEDRKVGGRTRKESKKHSDNNGLQEWFEIDGIVRRRRGSGGQWLYLVRFKNAELKWLPAKDITQPALQEFRDRISKTKKKRRRQ